MLGAGNVSTHLSRHLHSSGHPISAIYSRNMESARMLADELGTIGTSVPGDVPREADFYLVCVPDDAVERVALDFRDCQGIWLHTAGALAMDLFKGIQPRFGVLYPLQTMSRSRTINLGKTPFLVEGSSPEVTESITELAKCITDHVLEISSSRRLVIHLAAVFANNFSNHMVHIAQQILRDQEINPEIMGPILEETFQKIIQVGAGEAQTGPARRNDLETMEKHTEYLKRYPEWEKLYTFISRDIGRFRDKQPLYGK